jgi:hypothetical protein
MSAALTQIAHYRECAAASLGNAETARDKTHLAIARHFYALADDEINRLERGGTNLEQIGAKSVEPEPLLVSNTLKSRIKD